MASNGTGMLRRGRRANDDALVQYLSAGHTTEQAAVLAKVSRRTAFRRLADPSFRAKVDAVRTETLERLAATLLTASAGAVVTLATLSSSARSEHVRHAAARTLIEMMLAARAAGDVERRLIALEQAQIVPMRSVK
jgi:hypothetical protein